MTLAETIPAFALAITIVGFLINAAVRGARMETKLDISLDILHDHENRLRDKEGLPRLEEPRHSKPLHQTA